MTLACFSQIQYSITLPFSRMYARMRCQSGFASSSTRFPTITHCPFARVIATFSRFGSAEKPMAFDRTVDRMIASFSLP